MRLFLVDLLTRMADALRKEPDAGLPPDARTELDRWRGTDLEAYRKNHGGEAPPDAPHIEDGGI